MLAHLTLGLLLAVSPLAPGVLNPHTESQGDGHTAVLRTPAPSPVKNAGAIEPVISAKSALLLDLPSNQVLYSKDADRPRAIASLAKLMTALVVAERTKPDEVVTVG